jgi:hypothetical protein
MTIMLWTARISELIERTFVAQYGLSRWMKYLRVIDAAQPLLILRVGGIRT